MVAVTGVAVAAGRRYSGACTTCPPRPKAAMEPGATAATATTAVPQHTSVPTETAWSPKHTNTPFPTPHGTAVMCVDKARTTRCCCVAGIKFVQDVLNRAQEQHQTMRAKYCASLSTALCLRLCSYVILFASPQTRWFQVNEAASASASPPFFAASLSLRCTTTALASRRGRCGFGGFGGFGRGYHGPSSTNWRGWG